MRVTIAALLLLVTSFASAEYLAFAVNDKGRSPLPERIDEIDAKHFLNVGGARGAGPGDVRPRGATLRGGYGPGAGRRDIGAGRYYRLRGEHVR